MGHYYYTWLDRTFETLKYLCCLVVVFFTHHFMQRLVYQTAEKTEDVKFFVGDLFIGLALFGVIRLALDQILFHCFGLETLVAYDRIMLEDGPGNWTNIVAMTRWEKFEFEPMKKYIHERSENIHRLRSKLVKFFGVYYFKKMTDQEFETKKDVVITKLEGIHSNKDLSDFMCKQNEIRDPLNNVQWRMFLIPDFNEKESMLVFKAHHSMCDGLAIMAFNCLID